MSDKKLPSLAQQLIQGVARAKEEVKQSIGDDVQFMAFRKGGNWEYGADDIKVDAESVWAIDPNSLQTGFIAWPEEGEPAGEEMASIMGDPVIKADLPDVGESWEPQVGFMMRCIEGADAGIQSSFKSSSLGGRKAFKALLDVILERATAGEGDLVPLVYLTSSNYKHKKYGKIYTPELEVCEWSNHEAVAAEVGATLPEVEEAEPEKEALPEPEVEAEPEPEPEPEPEKKEAPKKRTRRSRKP